jgi:hypothetical protein
MSSSVLATESEAEEFLSLLSDICSKQKAISAALDQLILLLQLPSEDVLRVLQGLLIPMDLTLQDNNTTLAHVLLMARSGQDQEG